MKRKICPRCATENDTDANFCEICSWELSQDYDKHQVITYKVNFTGEIKIEKIK